MLGKKFVQNSCEIDQFFCESYSENPRNLPFFPRPIRSPEKSRCLTHKSENIFIFVMEVREPQCLFQCRSCKQQF